MWPASQDLKWFFYSVSIHTGIITNLTIRLSTAKQVLKCLPSQGKQSNSGKLESTTKFSAKKKRVYLHKRITTFNVAQKNIVILFSVL